MAGAKTDIALDAIVSLLAERIGEPVERLLPIAGGQVAQTFSFAVRDREYVVRFSRHMGAAFAKEVFIAAHYASAAVPIPPVIDVGRLGELDYVISVRSPGVTWLALPPAEAMALVPALMTTLQAIHAVDVRATGGFGVIGGEGNGLYSGWRASLLAIRDEEPEGEYYGAWHRLFETSFLERAAFDRLFARMRDLLPLCPEARFLVHGDFGFDNVLCTGETVSAVLDWSNAAYGDFLYDVAWIDFWGAGIGFAERFQEHYQRRAVAVPHFAGRLRCYQAYIALDASRFYAKAGQEASYRWLRDRVRALDLDPV
jgi:hygromycin-B 4-O-kinase